MKFHSKSGCWIGANVEYNPDTVRAVSYHWWCFLKRFGGVVVFNNYTYSKTTSKHQSQVLNKHGLANVDYFVRTRVSLESDHWISSALGNCNFDLISCVAKLNGKRIKPATREALEVKHKRLMELRKFLELMLIHQTDGKEQPDSMLRILNKKDDEKE